MPKLIHAWRDADGQHELRLVPVAGTAGKPYSFGAPANPQPIEIRDFHMANTPVTQVLWALVMGSNPAGRREPRHPVTEVSWDHVTVWFRYGITPDAHDGCIGFRLVLAPRDPGAR